MYSFFKREPKCGIIKKNIFPMDSTPLSSPWLAQLQGERPHFRLERDAACDIAIVGAGIAGISTAYYLLKMTSANVVLVDAGRIAHGATGRNAGQTVSYFERPFSDIARGFGLEMAAQGQFAVESAWGLIEDILRECQLHTPFYRCKGFAGFSTTQQILVQLEEKALRAKAGLIDPPLLVHTSSPVLRDIPEALATYVLQVPHSTILRALQTDNPLFIAAEASPKGCMNSALFCEELAGWMTTRYGDRLRIAEHLPVERILLGDGKAMLKTTGPSINARRVVLCTNGFENFSIENTAGPEIDTAFHMTVRGLIGYMAGYFDEPDQPALAVSYHRNMDFHDAYHYLTRRPYERDKARHSLVCIGGPERKLPDRAIYDASTPFPANIEEELDRELRTTYRDFAPKATRAFLWQGLMGYTPNNVRRVGFEPHNAALLYNLGCNGVGILPSIYGGKRIAQLLAGMQLPPSIFDPDKGDL